MKRRIMSIDEYVFESQRSEIETLEEAENLKEEYQKYFKETLESFGANSIRELEKEKRSEFFTKIKEGWIKGKGRKNVNEGSDIESDEDFKEWAEAKLKKMHGDKFDQDKADSVINGLLKKKEDDDLDYGALIGMLNK